MATAKKPPEQDIFDRIRLPPELDSFLRNINPWWEGKPGRVLPVHKRWIFNPILKRLEGKLAPIVILRGPRQVGKTTIQEQIIRHLLEEKQIDPRRIFRVQLDEIPPLRGLKTPVLSLAVWYENLVLEKSFNSSAHEGKPAYLFFDEAQNIEDWAPQFKALVDHNTVRVLISGSSALRIEAGRDSLAGRVQTMDLGTLLLREIAEFMGLGASDPLLPGNGLEAMLKVEFWREAQAKGISDRERRDAAFLAFSDRGGYPKAHESPDVPWPELADYLNETVIERVLQHDLRIGDRGRKRDEDLLEEVLRLACRYAGQSPGQAIFVNEIRTALKGNVGWQRILSYLKFLHGALLIRLVPPLEIRLKKKRGASKICLADHGLRASWLEEKIPLDAAGLEASPHLADLAGHIAESTVGAFLAGITHLDLAHFPERATEPEVDFILTIGERRIPLEVKYRKRIDPHRDTLALRAFLEKTVYNAPFGVLVTQSDGVAVPDPRIVTISLPSLLWMR